MQFDLNDGHSLTAKVYQYIHDGILDGKYNTGDYLVETKLADELDVSRTPIREALKQLELEELVVSVPNRGVMVQGMSDHDVDDIFTIRYLIEGQAAYWAAERVTDAQLEALGELMDLMELYTRKGDTAKLSKLDSEFHDILFSASDSRMLKHVLVMLHQNVQRARRSSLNAPERATKSYEEHMAIYDAVREHRAADAKALMEAHVSNVVHLPTEA